MGIVDEGATFGELIRDAKAGRPPALAELHRRYASPVLARVRQRLTPTLRRHYDTLDLTQSVFKDVLEDLPRFVDRGERAFRNWLYTRAENKVRMKLRRQLDGKGRRRERTVTNGAVLVARDEGPSTIAGGREDHARLETALTSMEAPEREILLLRVRERLSYAEIAGRLALRSPDAARMRYARALAALRSRWKSA